MLPPRSTIPYVNFIFMFWMYIIFTFQHVIHLTLLSWHAGWIYYFVSVVLKNTKPISAYKNTWMKKWRKRKIYSYFFFSSHALFVYGFSHRYHLLLFFKRLDTFVFAFVVRGINHPILRTVQVQMRQRVAFVLVVFRDPFLVWLVFPNWPCNWIVCCILPPNILGRRVLPCVPLVPTGIDHDSRYAKIGPIRNRECPWLW